MATQATTKSGLTQETVTLGRLRDQNIARFKAATGQAMDIKSFLVANSIKVAVMGFGATLFLILA